MKSKQSEPSKHSGFSTSDNSTANTPQDYSGNMKSFPSRSPSQGDEDSALILTQDNLKSSDPDLSANSDQESGVEDLSCRSPSGGECAPSEDSVKDRLWWSCVSHCLKFPCGDPKQRTHKKHFPKIREQCNLK